MIINQLLVWLKSLLDPTLALLVYKFPAPVDAPDNRVVINETGGKTDKFPDQFLKHVQIIVQDKDKESARKNIFLIYGLISEQYDISIDPLSGRELVDLPFVIAQMKALNDPEFIGNIGNGIYQYSVNYEIYGNFVNES